MGGIHPAAWRLQGDDRSRDPPGHAPGQSATKLHGQGAAPAAKGSGLRPQRRVAAMSQAASLRSTAQCSVGG